MTPVRPRLRDYGIQIGPYATGPHNAITDVEGVHVGHTTLIEGSGALVPGQGPVRTGVTAILPNAGNIFRERVTAGGFVLNGAGELSGMMQVLEWGLIETPIVLTNTMGVGTCSEAIVDFMVGRHDGIGAAHDVMIPVVGECDDSWLNDAAGLHIQASHVRAAIAAADSGPVLEGSVGGGTGMVTCDLKAGIGTSSRVVSLRGDHNYTIGVLVMSNFGVLEDLRIAGVPAGARLALGPESRRHEDYGSIIVVLATDAPLHSQQISRLCRRAALGVGRCGSIAAHGSGEIMVGFSTANPVPRDHGRMHHRFEILADPEIDPLYRATIDATEEAILNSLCGAEAMVGRDEHRIEALPDETLHYVASVLGTP